MRYNNPILLFPPLPLSGDFGPHTHVRLKTFDKSPSNGFFWQACMTGAAEKLRTLEEIHVDGTVLQQPVMKKPEEAATLTQQLICPQLLSAVMTSLAANQRCVSCLLTHSQAAALMKDEKKTTWCCQIFATGFNPGAPDRPLIMVTCSWWAATGEVPHSPTVPPRSAERARCGH